MIQVLNANDAALRLDSIMKRIVMLSGRNLFGVVRQGAIFAIQSSSKATKPGSSGTADGLAKKYKQRPILTSSARHGFFYEMNDGKTFKSESQITLMTGARILRQVKRHISKVIQWWNKKENGWDYVAYTGTPENEKFRKIPHYGAAKVGWYGSLGKLGASVSGTGENNAGRMSRMSILKTPLESGVKVTNMIDYTMKTSPQSASVGIVKAGNRMSKIYEAELRKFTKWIY